MLVITRKHGEQKGGWYSKKSEGRVLGEVMEDNQK